MTISDLHIGAAISKYKGELRDAIEQEIDRADVVTFNGDIYELFYVDKPKSVKKGAVIENAIQNALTAQTALLLAYPEKKFHFILGNHENITEYRHGKPVAKKEEDPYWNGLDGLKQTFLNFEWHPEAIRIGDGLFTHGDHQTSRTTDKTRSQYGVNDAQWHYQYSKLLEIGEDVGQAVVDRLRKPKRMAELVSKQLEIRAENGDFFYSHNREPYALSLDWVKHVFTGHTHVPFDNKVEPRSALIHHNSGALTRGRGVKEVSDIQALSFELLPDSRIVNVNRTFGKTKESER
jgi:UDP-2,3-diacylglucosamine pyrophosphatase LpxH